MISLLVAAQLLATAPRLPDCTPTQIAEVTEVTDTTLRLSCSVELSAGQTITRPLILEGAAARGTYIDCNGATIGRRGRNVTTAQPSVAIWSRKHIAGANTAVWERPTDITIRNCHIIGNLRIWGMGSDGSYDDLRASSRLEGHIGRTQDAAPTRINLDNLTLTGSGSIPLYIGPGVTEVSLTNSTLNGTTTATALYLDAESARNRIENNRFLTRTGREKIAVDGSAHNIISGNRFDLHGQPAILLYRNCGERGVVRHQTPSHNRIANNVFTGASWLRPKLVIENARNGRKSYCNDDAGYPFGSSLDDRDNATNNIILNNRR